MKKAVLCLAVIALTAACILAGAEGAAAWTCENGHAGNTGNFCSECGAPKPAPAAWTCENGHGGNTGKFCTECGAPKPAQGTAAAPEAAPESAPAYDNPFPDVVSRFTVPFPGIAVDHLIAIDELLSHASPSDAHYVEYEKSGRASDHLAWDKYSGASSDLYLIYDNSGQDVYAYAYACEFDASRRTEWASGALFPTLSTAIGAALWVDSGEDNDVYSQLLDQGSEQSDYEAVKRLIRSLDPFSSAMWFSHQLSIMREDLDGGVDRYWIFFHNTGN